MMKSHYPHKIENSPRYGKALCVTFLLLAATAFPAGADASVRTRTERQHATPSIPVLGGEVRERGPRSVALGGAGVAAGGSAESVLGNPALVTLAPDGGLICWTPARFGMSELGAAAAAWSQSFHGWGAAIVLQRFGFGAYAEHRAGLAVSTGLGDRLAAGLRLSALHIGIERYGNTIVPLLDAGVVFAPADGFRIGASGSSVNMPAIDGDERLPVLLAAGLAWEHDGLLVVLDAEKETRHDVNMRGGVEYRLLEILSLRCGVSTRTRQWSTGFALDHGVFRIAYTMSMHSELGASHTVGIGFER
jgi:hypothetical protein